MKTITTAELAIGIASLSIEDAQLHNTLDQAALILALLALPGQVKWVLPCGLELLVSVK